MLSVGIDIGGTKIAGGLVDESGAIVVRARVDTPSDPRGIEEAVADMVEELTAAADGADVVSVGVAAAGFIDRDRSTVHFAPNIAWRGEPLRERLEARLGLTVAIENDANAAGWAEYRFGAGRGLRDVTMLTLGTGVGGAIVASGELYRGGNGSAGELGHLRLVTDGVPCGCGQRGCLEQYASGRALQRISNEIADDPTSPLGAALAAVRAERGTITGKAISQLVLDGDPGAREALRRVAVAVGEGCGTLSAILDPELFVIGGGVSQLGDLLLAPMREAYLKAMPAAGSRPVADFAIAELTNDAGVIGVADLARREFEREGS